MMSNLLLMGLAIVLSVFASQRSKQPYSNISLAVLVGVLVAAPFISENKATLLPIYILGLAAAGWNIIGGFTGYAAFGQVAFYGLGAYTVILFGSTRRPPLAATSSISLSDQTLGWPLVLAFIMAAVIPGFIALLIGLP